MIPFILSLASLHSNVLAVRRKQPWEIQLSKSHNSARNNINHQCDVTCSLWCLNPSIVGLFVHQFDEVNINEDTKTPHYLPCVKQKPAEPEPELGQLHNTTARSFGFVVVCVGLVEFHFTDILPSHFTCILGEFVRMPELVKHFWRISVGTVHVYDTKYYIMTGKQTPSPYFIGRSELRHRPATHKTNTRNFPVISTFNNNYWDALFGDLLFQLTRELGQLA